jgi:hypothetical protein
LIPGNASKAFEASMLEDWNEEELDCLKEDFWLEEANAEDICLLDENAADCLAENWLVAAACSVLAPAHSPARGGVWARRLSTSCSRESGRLPAGESAQVTRRAAGAGLPSTDHSRSIEALCRKPSFFLLTNPVVTLPQPRP